MDGHLRRIFMMQIWYQCQYVVTAYDDAMTRIAEMRSSHMRPRVSVPFEPQPGNMDAYRAAAAAIALQEPTRIWYSIQSLLTATANISKALWGTKPTIEVQREPLRLALAVSAASPLASRVVRNHFDHFDEKVDEWWAKSQTHNYVDGGFGDMAAAISGIPPEEIFRSYNRATGDVVFWGQTYNLPQVVDEVNRIMPLAIAEATRIP